MFKTNQYLSAVSGRATDKEGKLNFKGPELPYFSSKSGVVGTQKNCLDETILLSTNNIGFREGIRKLVW